jgi:NTE family protein
VELTPEHALASAAIPLLFPSVLIGNHYYCDGALRENTPVAPALRLGADKVLIIALRERDEALPLAVPIQEPAYPGMPALLGKLLAGLMLDPLEFELDQLRRLNTLAEVARLKQEKDKKAGELYHQIDDLLCHVRGAGLRRADYVLVRPSTNIAALTGQLLEDAPDAIWGRGPVANFARRLARDTAGQESDLLSFLFFDGYYTRELIELGYRDAMKRSDELEAFFMED